MAVLVLGATEASAHAFPDHSDPRVGSTLDRGPSQVQIWFDGEIEPVFSTIRVENDDKQRVDKGDARVNPGNTRLLEVTMDPLPSGPLPRLLERDRARRPQDRGRFPLPRQVMLVATGVRWVTLLAMAAMLGALMVDILIVPRDVPAPRVQRWAIVGALVLLLAHGR